MSDEKHATRREIRRVACPKCGAEPGERCRGVRGEPRTTNHRERLEAAERTEAERIDPHEHIDHDDPRYDGFRMREYWVATAVAPDDQEAPLFVDRASAVRFHLSLGPAMAADERRLVHLREFAAFCALAWGVEVRIRHFVTEGDAEVFAPPEAKDSS